MISSAGRAPPLQGGGRRFDPVITHHFLASWISYDKIEVPKWVISSAGRAPPLQGGGRRFDPVITHHFGALAQLVEQLTFNQLVAGSNPARPTNVKRRPKGAFLLSAIYKIRTCSRFGPCLMRCAYQAYRQYRTRRPDKTLVAIRHRYHTVNAATSFSSAGVACCWSYTIYKSAGIRSSNGRNTTPGQLICA